MERGFYAVFEGADGSGKTSTMRNVANQLGERLVELGVMSEPEAQESIIQTHHPGSTALGKHLRKLVKFPHDVDPDIVMDDLSRQLLYMVDTVNFVSIILRPALEQHQIVLADRSSFISALIYGMADGLDIGDLDRLCSVITPPRMDRLYVLQCPWDVVQARIVASRHDAGTDGTGKLDHYDSKPSDFAQSISKAYAELVITSPEQTALIARSVAIPDVVHIDSSADEEIVAESITDDIIASMHKRCLIG